ncbi:MAG TPA: DUF4382 domain-containing protein [Gemmatimonadaceae bacterium]|nr:DUF4382 domain-containing protein [Gemmatimonadaceae bacterium]
MKQWRLMVLATAALGAAALPMACSDSGSTAPVDARNAGTVVVRLTDAPFLSDSVSRVDMYVVRVDARVADVDTASADANLDDNSSAANGWRAIATPNASFNLLSLQDGVATTIGQDVLAAGTYSGFRLIIDPTRSSVTLKNGQVLSGSTTPGITFPSASRSGIKIVLSQPLVVVPGTTTSLLVDFDVNSSFVMRGNSIAKNGLLFKPVIRATITNLALTNATVRLVNATSGSLTLLENGNALTGGSDLAFGTSSACSSVSAATPGLTVLQAGSSTPLAGFAPTLTAGNSFSIIAYPTSTGSVQFTTLPNAFAPTTGDAGLRVFNATTSTTGFDVFVTAVGAVLGTPTLSNVLSGTSSAFVSVPAGASQIRLATAGGTTVLLDLGSQTLTAGQNLTLVIAPPAAGSTTPRAFLVAGC